MKIDSYCEDICTAERRVMHFDRIGIEHLIRLGEVSYSSSYNRLTEHSHRDSFEFVFFQNGSQNYLVNSRLYHVKNGEMFITLPNEIHGSAQYFEERSHFFYLIFHFTPEIQEFLNFTAEELELAKKQLFSLTSRVFPVSRNIFTMLSQILNTYFSDDPFRRSRIDSCCSELFCELLSLLSHEQQGHEKQNESESLEIMMDYINRNISRNVSAAELAEYVHLSESRVHQIFSENSLTLHDYILRQKIEIAKEMLMHTHLSVTDIAFQLDFSSSQYFSTVFSRYAGISPTQYRKKFSV